MTDVSAEALHSDPATVEMRRKIYADQTLEGPAEQVSPSGLARRDFLKVVGGGVLVFFSTDTLRAAAEEADHRPPATPAALPTDFNAFLRVGADGRVTCLTGKIEMGQGIVTSLAQMLAEELDVSLDHVDMVMGDTTICPWDMGTWGSLTTRFFGPPLRQAAAEARAVLLDLAAESLHVPVGRLVVAQGVVRDQADKTKQVTYAQLTQGKRIERHLGKPLPLKTREHCQVMGRSAARTDGHAKVTGQARYAGDIRLPGMVYARMLRPPAHGAALRHVDISALKGRPDVQVIQDKDLVAVLHAHPEEAEKALALIRAEFAPVPETPDNQSIFAHLLASAPKDGEVVAQKGDLATGHQAATRTFDENWTDHYVAHASLETHAAVARFEGDQLTVWASTQTPFGLRNELCAAFNLSPDRVHVIAPFVGGGFGGKSFNQQAMEAARLARLSGKPVQVMWTRQEAFFFDTFRPAAIVKIQSGVTVAGEITFWQFDTYYAGSRGAEPIYAVPHYRHAAHGGLRPVQGGAHPFRVGAWRAPGNSTNTFARESQIDVMAAHAKVDPLAFRLKNLTDKRLIATLRAAAERFGWKARVAPTGLGQGVACAVDAGTCVAMMADVAVDRASGEVHVRRLVCAQDMGFVVNPEGARLQTEGAMTMGLGYALSEQVEFKGGRVVTENFDTYAIPRFSMVPRLETVFVDSPEAAPQGGGEPAITCVGAAIANAIFDATGVRLHQMAMTPERVKEALKSAHTQAAPSGAAAQGASSKKQGLEILAADYVPWFGDSNHE